MIFSRYGEVEVVLNLPARWACMIAVICFLGSILGFVGLLEAQTTDKPAQTSEATPKSSPETPKESADTQATDKPATVEVESSNPFSGDPEAIKSGRELYFTWCVQCHGKKADGVSPRWGKYAKDLRRFWKGYSQFVLITVQGVKGKQMPPWGEHLSGNQISHIGAYLETLAMEGANWR